MSSTIMFEVYYCSFVSCQSVNIASHELFSLYAVLLYKTFFHELNCAFENFVMTKSFQ